VEMARQQEEALEAEREKRIEHAKDMAIRRIFRRELTRGWTSWMSIYLDHQRRMRALASAGARMLRPKLVAAARLAQRTHSLHRAVHSSHHGTCGCIVCGAGGCRTALAQVMAYPGGE
jgi:hypothetical protein